MQPLKVMGLDGPAYEGTWWSVTEGGTDLEVYETRQKAVDKARNRFAKPGQEIKVVNTNGRVEVIREGDKSARTQRGGGHGGGLFGAGQVDDGGGLFGGGGGGLF